MGRKSRSLMVRKFILEEVVSQILSYPIKRQAGNTGSIAYDAKEDKYSIVNYSSNGTYLNGGQLLEREKVYHLPHGTTFRVTKEDEFKVL